MDDRAWKEEEERGPESFNLREGDIIRIGGGDTCPGKVFSIWKNSPFPTKNDKKPRQLAQHSLAFKRPLFLSSPRVRLCEGL